MGIPVNHSLDKPMVYVPATDDAWDHPKIDDDLAKIAAKVAAAKAAAERSAAIASGDWVGDEDEADEPEADASVPWESESEHPVRIYASGDSRFDLATVSGYLLQGRRPARFYMKRIGLRTWTEVVDLVSQNRTGEGLMLALRHGLDRIDIEGLDGFKLQRIKASNTISEESLNDLRHLIGEHEFVMACWAAYNANRGLQPAEKKP
jgi:hypothetical protein